MAEEPFDVIVVGAGSAGAALAARLTEDAGRRVLLLETGLDYRSADALPEIASVEPGKVQPTEALAAEYTFPSLQATRSRVQAPAAYLRGRGVGGSSAINGLFAIRATVEDFDGWAAAGCSGWGFADALPLLNRLETDLDFGDEPYHGDDGPIPVVRPRRASFAPVDAAVDVITERRGHPWAPDHNAPGTTGASPYAFNGRDGRRVSTNDAYLEGARGRDGLRIVGGVHVDRVLFSSAGRAIGVAAIVEGAVVEHRAAEVVLCAGAIHTPAILQRSGVGPAALLGGLDVDVVADLPVGLGLQEHPGIALALALREAPDYGELPQRGQICVRSTSGIGDEPNDVMFAVVGALGIGLPVAGIAGWVNRVTSTGAVSITSADPTVEPRVEFDMLSTPEDMARFRVVFDELCAWASQPELRSLTTSMGFGESMVAPDTRMTDREFTDFALATVADTVHATSTCSIGSVVDPSGRVLGVDGLRVADASILPWTTRANTNLTAIFVGERIAADMRDGR